MKDEQVRRYARHILLPEVGGLGQTALLQASARVVLRESTPEAELIAARYLAAGGVGTVVVAGASEAQIAAVAAAGPDTRVVSTGAGTDVALQPMPAWWPHAEGDELALAFWRGAIAATRWMAAVATR